MSTSILHLFFFTCFLLWKMHYLDHILECPIGPSLKVVQLRRLFDWTNMAAALPQFFGAARHPCFEVSGVDHRWTRLCCPNYNRSTWGLSNAWAWTCLDKIVWRRGELLIEKNTHHEGNELKIIFQEWVPQGRNSEQELEPFLLRPRIYKTNTFWAS